MAEPFIKPDSPYGKLVESVAAYYSPSKIRGFLDALDTAMDDSYEWSKNSDEGDNRREVEGDNLGRLWRLFNDARDHQRFSDARDHQRKDGVK
jgi:hypothetical protein